MGLLTYTHQIIIETEHTMDRTQNTAENVGKFTIILNLEPLYNSILVFISDITTRLNQRKLREEGEWFFV